MRTKTLSFLVFFLLYSTLAHPQVFKWIDEDGKVHFGDSPPDSVNAETMQLPEGPSPTEISRAKIELEKQLARRERSEQAAVQEKPEEDDNFFADEEPYYNEKKFSPRLTCTTVTQYESISQEEHIELQYMPPRTDEGLRKLQGKWNGEFTEVDCRVDERKTREYVKAKGRAVVRGSWNERKKILTLEKTLSGSSDFNEGKSYEHFHISDDGFFFAGPGGIPLHNVSAQISEHGVRLDGNSVKETGLEFSIFHTTAIGDNVYNKTMVLRQFRVGAWGLEILELHNVNGENEKLLSLKLR